MPKPATKGGAQPAVRGRRNAAAIASLLPAEGVPLSELGVPADGLIGPLDVQLATMRALWAASLKEDRMVRLDVARQACDVAKAVAPYLHARFGSAEPASATGLRHEDALRELD